MPVARGEGEGQASGNGIFRNSVTIATPASSSSSLHPVATETTETETGTDFGLVGFAWSDVPRGTSSEEINDHTFIWMAGTSGLKVWTIE